MKLGQRFISLAGKVGRVGGKERHREERQGFFFFTVERRRCLSFKPSGEETRGEDDLHTSAYVSICQHTLAYVSGEETRGEDDMRVDNEAGGAVA